MRKLIHLRFPHELNNYSIKYIVYILLRLSNVLFMRLLPFKLRRVAMSEPLKESTIMHGSQNYLVFRIRKVFFFFLFLFFCVFAMMPTVFFAMKKKKCATVRLNTKTRYSLPTHTAKRSSWITVVYTQDQKDIPNYLYLRFGVSMRAQENVVRRTWN